MKAKCLETRRKGALVFRRYLKADNQRRVGTVEIPVGIYRSLKRYIDPRVAAWERGEAARDRLAHVLALAAEGNKQDYIADVVGVSQSYVSKALKNHKAKL